MQRYFVNVTPANEVTLPSEAAHHLLKVMRAEVGTSVELVLADHCVYLATLSTKEPTATLKINQKLDADSELPVSVTLACGIPKTKEKPELIVQKATELGADKIVFYHFYCQYRAVGSLCGDSASGFQICGSAKCLVPRGVCCCTHLS